MTRYALDSAWAPYPFPEEASRNGFEGYVRYFAMKTPATVGKLWTPQQIADCHGHGMWVHGVWEEQADRPTYGKNTGISDAHAAEEMWAALGAPKDSSISYAYDFDPDPQQVLPYAEGVREAASFPVCAYCSDGVAVELNKRGLIDYFWQTESTGFRGRWPSPIAHMIQHVGYQRPHMTGDYDENTVLRNFAQWGPNGTIHEGGDDLTPDESKMLKAVYDALAGTRPDSSNIEDAVLFKGPDGKLYRRLDRVEAKLAEIEAKLPQ